MESLTHSKHEWLESLNETDRATTENDRQTQVSHSIMKEESEFSCDQQEVFT